MEKKFEDVTLNKPNSLALRNVISVDASLAFEKSFSEYIGISEEEFWKKVYKSVNRELFDVSENGRINRKFKVGFGL